MKENTPLVSIVVPMHNAEDFIAKTLSSLLKEEELPIEIIVVNDKSTDRSLVRAQAFSDDRIRIVDGPGRGAAAAMNTGFELARGSIVMHCDADDLYPKNRISRQVTLLSAHPDMDAVCGSFSTIDSGDRPLSEMQCGEEAVEITEELRQGTVRTSLCTYAIRAGSMKRAGGFREYFESSYDIDMQLRFCDSSRIYYVPENFYLYRLHGSSITHSQGSVRREFYERTAREFQNQRKNSGLDDLQRGNPPEKPSPGTSSTASANAHIQSILIGKAWREHAEGRRINALRIGFRALIAKPVNLSAWKCLAALALIAPKNPK